MLTLKRVRANALMGFTVNFASESTCLIPIQYIEHPDQAREVAFGDHSWWKVRVSMADFVADFAADFLAELATDFLADLQRICWRLFLWLFLVDWSADFSVGFAWNRRQISLKTLPNPVKQRTAVLWAHRSDPAIAPHKPSRFLEWLPGGVLACSPINLQGAPEQLQAAVRSKAALIGIWGLPALPITKKGGANEKWQKSSCSGCSVFAYSWKLPAYIGAFLLTVDNLNFCAYNWSFFTYILRFLLTVGALCLQWESASNKCLKGLQAKKLNCKSKSSNCKLE